MFTNFSSSGECGHERCLPTFQTPPPTSILATISSQLFPQAHHVPTSSPQTGSVTDTLYRIASTDTSFSPHIRQTCIAYSSRHANTTTNHRIRCFNSHRVPTTALCHSQCHRPKIPPRSSRHAHRPSHPRSSRGRRPRLAGHSRDWFPRPHFTRKPHTARRHGESGGDGSGAYQGIDGRAGEEEAEKRLPEDNKAQASIHAFTDRSH